MAKKKPDVSFNFGENAKRGKKPKGSSQRQPPATRRDYAIARRTGQLPYGGS